jgi:predicted ATP-binding protein involved in virulence
MIIEELGLAHYRGFEQIDLKFDPRVTVIAGVNGVGKSGILHAIAVLFSKSLPSFTQAAPNSSIQFEADDILVGKPTMDLSLEFVVADQRCHIEVLRARSDGDQQGDLHGILLENIRTDAVRTGQLDAAQRETQRVLGELKRLPAQPLVVLYSPQRQLPGKPKTLPKAEPFAVREAYTNALQRDRDLSLRQFMHWYHVQEAYEDSGSATRKKVLVRLRQVVETFMEGFTNLRIEMEPLRLLVDKHGIPLSLNQLSDGERGMLAILFDLTRRLAIANPESEDPVSEGKAVVMIDELELHLHPVWQRRILSMFTETFKSCQFIVTTHSPLLLGEVDATKVRFLTRENGKVVSWTPPHSLGLDANRILTDLMGVESRREAMTEQLDELSRIIEQENFAEARVKIAQLAQVLGENDPELTRASTMIEFLEADE